MINYTNIMKDKSAYFSDEEIEKMFQYCFDIENIKYYMLILTLQRTGRRVSEIVGAKPFLYNKGLRPCDIHPDGLIEFDILKKNHIKSKNRQGKTLNEEKILKARLTKEPKRQLFPVDEFFLQELKKYIDHLGIMPYERVFPMTRQGVDKIIKKIAKGCNISRSNCKIHAHMFRHTFAINLLKKESSNPAALLILKDLLDHSSIEVTQTYTQFTPGDKAKVLNNIFIK